MAVHVIVTPPPPLIRLGFLLGFDVLVGVEVIVGVSVRASGAALLAGAIPASSARVPMAAIEDAVTEGLSSFRNEVTFPLEEYNRSYFSACVSDMLR